MVDLRPEWPGLRPENLDLKPERPNMRLERPGLRPEKLDLRPQRPDLRPERLDLRPRRLDLRPKMPCLRPEILYLMHERPDLRPEWLDERGGKQTNEWTDKQNSPCVPQDFVTFRVAAQKPSQASNHPLMASNLPPQPSVHGWTDGPLPCFLSSISHHK